ncbi:MAG: transposase [Candidatus Acidiferrales bacterium]
MNDSTALPNRRSIRLRAFDYSQRASYFVTIATHNSKHIFGEIILNQMKLSRIGQIVSECWTEIPDHFPAIVLGESIVMPNHIHGVIVIRARARHAVPLQSQAESVEAFGRPRVASIPTVVRSFKSAVSLRARKALAQPTMQVWQRNYFERVIRGEREFSKVRKYILQNPARWEWEKAAFNDTYDFDK